MKGKSSVVCLCLLLCLFCPAEEVRAITVTGRVIDYQARPVEGATVACYKSAYDVSKSSDQPLEPALTTSDGRFRFQVSKEYSGPLLVAGKEGLALGWSSINVASDLVPTIRLGKPSLFKGTVVDEAGHPVTGARVRICLRNEMMARHCEIAPLVPESWFIARTNAQGQFTFDNIPEGSTADFGVEAPGRASVWTFCDFGLDRGERFVAGRTDIRIVLPPEAHIRGQVVDELRGEGVADVNVAAVPYDSGARSFYEDPVRTDSNGRFAFGKLAPDKYVLCATSQELGAGNLTVAVEAGQTLPDVAIPLKGVPLEVITYGAEKGEPLENARVTVTQKETAFGYAVFRQTVITDANGVARFSVAPGECEIAVLKAGYGAIFQPQRVQLDPGRIVRHEISVPRTAVILSGEVLDEQGRPLADAVVTQVGFGPRVLTDARGRFDTSHIGYHISRNLPSKVSVLARHMPSGLGAIGTLEDPNKLGRPRGRIILKPASTITGCVTDPAGRGIPAAYVRLLQGRTRDLVTEVATDANGVYCIRSIPPQEAGSRDAYVITACAEGFGTTQVIHIPFHEDIGEPVRVDPIVLPPADQVISGVVQDSNDQPVAGAVVSVYGPRLSTSVGQPPCGKTVTDAQGRFHIAGLCKEPLEIRAHSPVSQQQAGTTWAQGGGESIRVVLGQELIFSKSLVGRPLPGLERIKVDPPAHQAKDKMLLVCFFDMNQRPSRNCITQLAKQVEQLKEKGVTVLAVQASTVNENTLNGWVKKNNVSFPVGMIQDNEQQIRFAWGVKSLPWLVLTNKEHIVTAEGFAVSELQQQIGK